MIRINPIYIGLLLLVIFCFFSFKLYNAKAEFLKEQKSYKEMSALSIKLSQLKKIYTKKPNLLRLKSKSVVLKKIKDGVILSSSSIDKSELNFIMSRVLNNSYRITQLKIKKLNQNKASLYMEIKW